jgi:hypothetical protein
VEVASTGTAAASGSRLVPKLSEVPDTVHELTTVALTWKLPVLVPARAGADQATTEARAIADKRRPDGTNDLRMETALGSTDGAGLPEYRQATARSADGVAPKPMRGDLGKNSRQLPYRVLQGGNRDAKMRR